MQVRLKDKVKGKPVVSPVLEKKAEFNLIEVKALTIKLTKLQVVTPITATPEQYRMMDEFLGEIQQQQDEWAGLIRPAIDPIKAGILALEKLDRTVRKPLDALTLGAKEWMRLYNIEQARIAHAKLLVADTLRVEAGKKMELASQTAVGALRNKLLSSAVKMEKQADMAEESVTVTEAEGSAARGKLKWRVAGTNVQEDCESLPPHIMTNLIRNVLDGKLPFSILQLNAKTVNIAFKDMPAAVMEWPCFETYEDFVIARKS